MSAPDLVPDPAAPPPRARRTSTILLEFARTFPHARVHIGDLDRLLADRAFGFLLLVFALPNTVPLGIPGLSTLTGVPMALVALQMVAGRRAPYLPGWVARRSLRRHDFQRLVVRTAPWLQRLERVLRPRWRVFGVLTAERWMGAVCLLLAVVLALPIPFGNWPPAIAVALISLGLIEEDGLLVSAGLVVGAMSLVLVWAVLWAMLEAALLFLRHILAG